MTIYTLQDLEEFIKLSGESATVLSFKSFLQAKELEKEPAKYDDEDFEELLKQAAELERIL